MTKILVADDHAIVRDGLRGYLQTLGDSVEVIEASDWEQTAILVRNHADLDLALIDLQMPGPACNVALAELMRTCPELPVLVLSASESVDDMRSAMQAGAAGYITKNEPPTVMMSAIRLVIDGGMYVPPSLAKLPLVKRGTVDPIDRDLNLTRRQLEVLRLIIEGKSNAEIAEALNLTRATVKAHLAATFRMLGVNNRTQAAVVAQRHGLYVRRANS